MSKINISVEKLFELGAHFGHQSSRSHPKAKEYIYTEEGNVLVFDLVKTKQLLADAISFLAKLAKDKKGILFVGTKKQIKDKIKEAALNSGSYFINERWPGGMLTNFEQIKKSLKKMKDLKDMKNSGNLKDYTKKERLLIDREITRLEELFGGLVGINELPSALVVVDIRREKTAVFEASKMGVPVVGIVDSNSDPNMVDYPIPMNDDSTEAVGYVLSLISEGVKMAREGKKVEIE
jgi:small subunit ribosomal protein S2